MKRPEPLTRRQEEIWQYMAETVRASYQPPTLREIMKRFGFASTNAASWHLNAMERRGRLERAGRYHQRALVLYDVEGEVVQPGRLLPNPCEEPGLWPDVIYTASGATLHRAVWDNWRARRG